MLCGNPYKNDDEGYGQRVWCSKEGSCSLNLAGALQGSRTQNEDHGKHGKLPNDTGVKRNLTDIERARLIQKNRDNPKMTQSELAEWGKLTFNLASLKQNTVSNILNAAGRQIQTGKLTLGQRNEIYNYGRLHPAVTQKKVCEWAKAQFNLQKAPSQSTISDIMNKRLKSMEQTAATSQDNNRKRARCVKSPEIEDALVLWVLQCEQRSIPINMPLIQQQAKKFAQKLNLPEDKQLLYSIGWCQKFMSFYNLRCIRMTGEAASADEEAIKANLPNIIAEISKFRRCDVFNMDETGLFFKLAPDRTIASRQISGSKKDKSRITIAFTANSDGSEKLPPLFIGHSKMPRAFNKKPAAQHGFLYRSNQKAWMTAVLFQEWLIGFESQMAQQNRKVLLLLDNAPTHIISNLTLNHVEVMFLPPNTTSRIQPMDAGIIAAMKKRYRSFQLQRALDLEEIGHKNIFNVDVLQAMKWSQEAWDSVGPATIENCWRHSGVLGCQITPKSVEESNIASDDFVLRQQIANLCLEQPMTAEELILSDSSAAVHQILTEEEIIVHVQRASSSSSTDLEHLSDDDVEEYLPLQERIRALKTTILILDEEPTHHAEMIKSLRKLLIQLTDSERILRQSKLAQTSITAFFS